MIDRFRQAMGYRIPSLGPVPFRLFQRFGPKTIRTHLFPRIWADLNLRDTTQLVAWWRGERFDSPTGQVLKYWLQEGASTFFDIGANFGFFSFLACNAQPNVRVHAFEPHPKTFQVLQSIQRENKLDHLTCWHMGLSDATSVLELHSGTEDLGHSSFGQHPEFVNVTPTFKVPVQSFGEWRRRQGIPIPSRPEWVAKIDVEGFEPKVLEGMREELAAHAFKGIIIEINIYTLGFCQALPDDIYRAFKSFGYRPAAAEEIHPSLRGHGGNTFFIPDEPTGRNPGCS